MEMGRQIVIPTLLIVATAVTATAALILLCREIDSRIRRRQQKKFLSGALREHVQWMMSQPEPARVSDETSVSPAVQPVALLTHDPRWTPSAACNR